MLGHRKLELDDYHAILKRRWWILAIPAVVLPIVAYAITFFVAPTYLSQTLVLIDEQKVPDTYVKSVISSDLDSRLGSMKEQILSRSRLEPIIERYNLYSDRHLSMDDRVELARKSITIKPITSEIAHSNGLPGFYIFFEAGDARTAQLVCGEITSLFLGENLKSREASAEGTTDFLKGQLEDAKRNLDEQDAKLAAFQQENAGKLPGEESPNFNMFQSLNAQLDAVTQDIARLEQSKSYGEAMLSQQTQASQPGSGTSAAAGGAAGASQAVQAAQQTELQGLLAEEADLTSHYTADYPDVIAVRRKIADLRRQMAAPVAAATGRSAAGGSSPRRADSPAVQQLRAQLHADDVSLAEKRREQGEIEANIRKYQAMIQASPAIEAQYKELTRGYQTAQGFYDDLLTKMNQSKMATDLEKRQEGEQFRIEDEPNLPTEPTSPKRGVFVAGGLAAGLALGLLIVALLEYKDTALRSERDVWAFTHLPTLATISYFDEMERAPEKKTGFALFKRSAQPKKTEATPDHV